MKETSFLLIIVIFALAFSAILKNIQQDERIEKLDARCTALEAK